MNMDPKHCLMFMPNLFHYVTPSHKSNSHLLNETAQLLEEALALQTVLLSQLNKHGFKSTNVYLCTKPVSQLQTVQPELVRLPGECTC